MNSRWLQVRDLNLHIFEPTHISRPASKLDRPSGPRPPEPPPPHQKVDFELAVGVVYGRYLSMFQTQVEPFACLLGWSQDAVKKAKKIPIYGKRTPTAVLA